MKWVFSHFQSRRKWKHSWLPVLIQKEMEMYMAVSYSPQEVELYLAKVPHLSPQEDSRQLNNNLSCSMRIIASASQKCPALFQRVATSLSLVFPSLTKALQPWHKQDLHNLAVAQRYPSPSFYFHCKQVSAWRTGEKCWWGRQDKGKQSYHKAYCRVSVHLYLINTEKSKKVSK